MRVKMSLVSTRTISSGPVSVNNYFWKLNECTTYEKYTAIFKYYRIRGIKVTFWPTVNTYQKWESNASGGGTISTVPKPTLPRMAWIKNRQGLSTADILPTDPTLQGMMNNTEAKLIMIPTEKPLSIYMKPNTIGRVVQGRAETAGSAITASTTDEPIQEYGRWFSCDQSNDVTYYGLVVMFDTPGADANNQFQYYQKITYYVEFKGNRAQTN